MAAPPHLPSPPSPGSLVSSQPPAPCTHSVGTPAAKRHRRLSRARPAPAPVPPDNLATVGPDGSAHLGGDEWSGIFVEMFGSGLMSGAVAERGVPTLCPQGQNGELEHESHTNWMELYRSREPATTDPTSRPDWFISKGGPAEPTLQSTHRRLCCYFDPPRSSFLRSRDRNQRTRLRTPELPWGHPPV